MEKEIFKEVVALIKKYPNDYDLGKKVREMIKSKIKENNNDNRN